MLLATGFLYEWFHHRRRPLPWRTPRGVRRDPWQTLVSEVMSQQTRLEVVVPRFQQWMEQFPTPAHLARASEQEVLAAWAGMGYYSRARHLQKAAQAVAERGWPSDHNGFLTLPGVGPYTAAALASLCFGEQVPMIDGNVLRVLSRIHALGQDLRSGPGKRLLEQLAMEWISHGDAGEINEATMELGALICLPKNPKCADCPLSESCKACAQGDPERFPRRKLKTESVDLVRDVAIVDIEGGILLRPSRPDELLRGLLVPPDLSEIPRTANLLPCGEVRHAITHHKVLWKVHGATLDNFRLPKEWVRVLKADLPSQVVSSLVRKALTLAGVWPQPT